jgi:plastocyanin
MQRSPLTILGCARWLAPLLLLSASANAGVVIINQFGFVFDPPTINVNIGDTVRWVHGGGNHDVTEGTDGTIDGDEAFFGLLDNQNPTFEVTFDQAFLNANPRPGNVYDYFCSPHFSVGMIAQLTVVDPVGTTFCIGDGTDVTCPCGNTAGSDEGCRNSTGSGATLVAGGSASVGADDLTFAGALLPSSKPCLLFSGNSSTAVPLGDGVRCVATQIKRYSVILTSASGTIDFGPGLQSTGGYSNGDTRYFQLWYRDPQGSACGNGFNLSSGAQVNFQP